MSSVARVRYPRQQPVSLDPQDWSALRALGHRMLDDAFDDLAGLRARPVWQPMPDAVRDAFAGPIGTAPEDPATIYDDVWRLVRPYLADNRHPRFMGWVQGGGTAVGMLAELLAGAMNANCGGRDHAPLAVERQVIAWAASMLGMPPESTGVLVTGTSLANFIAVLIARAARLGPRVRMEGLGATKLRAYATATAHGCLRRAFDMAGIGVDALRMVARDGAGRMAPDALRAAVAADRAAGLVPLMAVGTAGSVDAGVIDNLDAIADVAAETGLWFHVDAAYGAMAMLAPSLRPRLRGIGRADTVAFDFHKWGQVPYDAGCLIARDPAAHRAAFAADAAYLRRDARGMARGETWPTDLGPDLSRGFRALKVWMTIRAHGNAALGAVAERCCAAARALGAVVEREPRLELMAPVALNIVCFRVRSEAAGIDALNADLAADVQESGAFALSTTTLDGRVCLRAAIVNHRTTEADACALAGAVLEAARRRAA